MKFSCILNAKTFMFVYNNFLLNKDFFIEILCDVAAMFLLYMCKVSLILKKYDFLTFH